MQRFLTLVLAVALLVAAASFVAAPLFAFHALQASADAQDVEGLAQVVDFDAVRTSLKGELAGSASAAPPSFWQDPLAAIQSAITPMKSDDRVEALLRPAALAALTRGDGWDAVRAKGPVSGAGKTMPAVRYWGPNRCRLAVTASRPGWGETLFTFERKGVFRWKLVQIAMPTRTSTAGLSASPAGASAPAPAG